MEQVRINEQSDADQSNGQTVQEPTTQPSQTNDKEKAPKTPDTNSNQNQQSRVPKRATDVV